VTEHPVDFLELFHGEANERLDNMVSALLALERGDSPTVPIAELFREAHTIKGAAGMLGLESVHDLAHVLEDLLSDVRDSGVFPSGLADPLLRSIDTLRNLIAGGVGSPAMLITELAALRATETPLTEPSVAGGGPDHGPAPQIAEAIDRELETTDRGIGSGIDSGATPTAATAAAPSTRRAVHVPVEKIDRLLDLVGETALHRSRFRYVIAQRDRNRTDTDIEIDIADELDIGERLITELKDTAIGMRTLPLASIVGGLPRAVRDLAHAEGKEVELQLVGTDTELDRVILEGLPELLTHLLRNAVAHGIEPPDERERSRKPRRGTITLCAEQRGSEVEIVLSDDGRGVSRELFDRTRDSGTLTEILTQTGYSTAESVTGLAGRGVGLDAVRNRVAGYGGRLEIRSEPGRGTSVTLLLPLALALMEVLLVERDGHAFGIPLSAVEEVLSVGDALVLEGRPALDFRGSTVPLFDIADVIGADAQPLAQPTPAAVVVAGDRRAAIACDVLIGQEGIVVKPLGVLSDIAGYVGGAILGDGRIALLLDLEHVFQHRQPRSQPAVAHEVSSRAAPKVLVVEDFFTVRELQRSILEAAGYRVVTAENGLDALERLRTDEEIALVITDIEMPVMNGFELTAAIRAGPERATLPIVIVTTRERPEDRQRGLEVGADAYMVKRGFDQQTLLEAVERLVGR